MPADEPGRVLLFAAAHASEHPSAGDGVTGGDAVDLAFIAAAEDQGWQPSSQPGVLVERIPYEPEKGFCAVFHQGKDGQTAYVKGAPETVAAFCAKADHAAMEAAERLSAEGYRVLAVAAGCVGTTVEDGLCGLRLLGFAGLIDPLRPEAKTAIAAAKEAGIRVVMVTGDHALTALAIARQLSLAAAADEVLTGKDLARLQGPSLDAAIAKATVFARTEPLQKLAIVESLRRQGHVVAVTGDGINDAPALHAADIGVAMGKGGTDLARDTADLILSDDNFSSIIAGIEEGRVAYDNLRKVILQVVSLGGAEILIMLTASLLGFPAPLTAVQLLWFNLTTNSIQVMALAFEKGEPDILKRRPRPANAAILDRNMIEQIALSGATMAAIAFAYYYMALSSGLAHDRVQAGVLWILVWLANAHCFNCRSETRSIFTIPLANNPLLIVGIAATQLVQVAVVAIPPMRDLLTLDGLTVVDGMSLAVASLGVLLVMELYKLLHRSRT